MNEIILFKILIASFYVGLTLWLSWVGMRKTHNLSGFSIGNKDMSAFLVGVTMAASISSTATFVINPGFVYVHGLSALLHYGVAMTMGVVGALVLVSKGFLKHGDVHHALTVPDWIQSRYQAPWLGRYFALINLLSISFIVLILVGCGSLLEELFGWDRVTALTAVAVFVFGYVLMGGTYAHAYTNFFQGLMMFGISLFLVAQGMKYFSSERIIQVLSEHPTYFDFFNSQSTLYYDAYSTVISIFLVSFAIAFQPHIITKVLYLKSSRDTRQFLWVTGVGMTIFGLVLMLGFYARLKGLNIDIQDRVVVEYISSEFSTTVIGPYLLTLISVCLLAAGMSTLDGILVSLSSIIVNDLFLPFYKKDAFSEEAGLKFSRYVLVGIGVVAYVIALNPPRLVGIFAQTGVYGLAAASFVPILAGTLLNMPIRAQSIFLCSVLGLGGHLLLKFGLGIANPSVSASIALIMSTVAFIGMQLLLKPFNGLKQ